MASRKTPVWGSLLYNAVADLEARLDTLLEPQSNGSKPRKSKDSGAADLQGQSSNSVQARPHNQAAGRVKVPSGTPSTTTPFNAPLATDDKPLSSADAGTNQPRVVKAVESPHASVAWRSVEVNALAEPSTVRTEVSLPDQAASNVRPRSPQLMLPAEAAASTQILDHGIIDQPLVHTSPIASSANFQAPDMSLSVQITALKHERDEALQRESIMRKRTRNALARIHLLQDELERLGIMHGIQVPERIMDGDTSAPNPLTHIFSSKNGSGQANGRSRAFSYPGCDGLRRDAYPRNMSNLSIHAAGSKQKSPHVPSQDTPRVFVQQQPSTDSSGNQLKCDRCGAPLLEKVEHRATLHEQDAQANLAQDEALDEAKDKAGDRGGPRAMQRLLHQTSTESMPQDRDGPTQQATEACCDTEEKFDSSHTPFSACDEPVSVHSHQPESLHSFAPGPTVQLVERLSATIRRLEAEKVASKDEISRISSQRDEARNQVVVLVKELQAEKNTASKVQEVNDELEQMTKRYHTTLELLGEKTELVEEMMNDISDLKDMYRELVERSVDTGVGVSKK